ncbi:MAG TPA: hypothetical protein VGS41_14605, partial [Chthonomonadales bacterium]|nr:hypothetical protein [Chthonomonadales bacterium]
DAQETGVFPYLALPVLMGLAQVKNEGLLAGVICSAVLPWCITRHLSGTADRPDRGSGKLVFLGYAGMCLAAVIAASAPWWVLRQAWRIHGDILEAPRHLTLGILWWRLGYALRGMIIEIFRIGPWLPCWGLTGALLLFGMAQFLGGRCNVTRPVWLVCALQLTGYLVVCLITPHPLEWHLATSVDRLWLHVVPALLLAALICSLSGTPSRTAT